jgi:NifU-like protein involved in Fe-S cluster formation
MQKQPDVNACGGNPSWVYSDTVKEHFLNPQNFLIDEDTYIADGIGMVGSPACGDMMVVWIKVDEAGERITECKWRTFGCASAIASTSMMSVMVTEDGGMLLKHARRLTPEAIIERLGGLPDQKYHCSVLGHQALREAIEDYEQNKNSNHAT